MPNVREVQGLAKRPAFAGRSDSRKAATYTSYGPQHPAYMEACQVGLQAIVGGHRVLMIKSGPGEPRAFCIPCSGRKSVSGLIFSMARLTLP
jgi:hypothetical protein